MPQLAATRLTALVLRIGATLLAVAPHTVTAEPWGTAYDRFFEAPGAEVTTSTEPDGTEIRRVMTPGRVEIREYRKDGGVQTLLMDLSGHGAVLCTFTIAVDAKHFLEFCRPPEHPVAIERLSAMIDQMTAFIAQNSLEQTAIEDLQAWIGNKRHEAAQMAMSADWQLACRNGESAEFVENIASGLEKQSDSEFLAQIGEMLSVPRLPVMNPCL